VVGGEAVVQQMGIITLAKLLYYRNPVGLRWMTLSLFRCV